MLLYGVRYNQNLFTKNELSFLRNNSFNLEEDKDYNLLSVIKVEDCDYTKDELNKVRIHIKNSSSYDQVIDNQINLVISELNDYISYDLNEFKITEPEIEKLIKLFDLYRSKELIDSDSNLSIEI